MDGAGRTPPPLVLCVSALSILDQDTSHIFISFFCSLHSDQDEITHNGPNAILRSLIARLIFSPHAEIRHMEPIEEVMVDTARGHDLGALYFLFNAPVSCMNSSKTIYCLIDNNSDFDIPWDDWDQQITQALQDLLEAARTRRYVARVTFLLTSSTHVNEIASLVNQDGDEYISMRAGWIRNRPINSQEFHDDLELLKTLSSTQQR